MNDRPLSPHMQIYKPQMTSMLSISHRMTGIVLYFGFFVISYLTYCLAFDIEAFTAWSAHLNGIIGHVLLIGWSFCFYYHLCNGVRHLFWDAGIGFELHTVTKTGIAVMIGSVLLTTLSWSYILYYF